VLRGANQRYLALAAGVLAAAALVFFWWRGAEPEPTFTPEEVKNIFHKKGCVNCHDIRNPLVGPPFEAIAERYASDPEAEEKLVRSIREGSEGRWFGPDATTIYGIKKVMPANDRERLSDAEVRAMVRWILERGWLR